MDAKCTLVILFNHPHPRNIDKLRKIYGDRFDDIVFLMPIIDVPDLSVFTVYRGGFAFHGHVADALGFLLCRDAEMFVFCQDDLLLNPKVTPQALYETFRLDACDGLIPQPESFSAPGRASWPWNDRVLSRILEPTSLLFGGGVERFATHLPPLDDAKRRFDRLGFTDLSLPKPPPRIGAAGLIQDKVANVLGRRRPAQLPYPLAVAFSDFFILKRAALSRVAAYFGLFAAMDLFVEVAIPTAMILGCETLATFKGTSWRVEIDWTDRDELARQQPKSLESYYEAFDENLLYMHPVKLSAVTLADH